MRVSLLISVAAATLFVSGGALADESIVRDWTIEKPFAAGLINGMTLGLAPGSRFATQARPANSNDPFGMSPLVRDMLLGWAAVPYRIGRSVGGLFTFLILFGAWFRRRNTLMVRQTFERSA